MYKSQTLTAVIAASLVLSSATPVFAKTTRSTDAIPARTTLAAAKAAGSSQRLGGSIATQSSLVATPAASVVAPLSTTSSLAAPAAVVQTSALASQSTRTTLARTSNRPAKPSLNLPGFGSASRIADLFDVLPPSVQQVIANALANAPGGGDFCETLGIPGCQLPDSNG